MTDLIYPYTFEGGQKAVASEVNANFDAVKMFANGINATISELQTAIAALEKKPTREMFDVYFSFSGTPPVGAYPLWTGETITNCKLLFPDFWRKLLQMAHTNQVPVVESNAAFDEKVATFSQCPAFYIDELNGHVRLPKITRFISSISELSELGNAVNDQIKSHTHNIKNVPILNTSNPNAYLFHRDGARVRTSGYTASEAAGGNETYPKHVKLCLYLQVANNTNEIAAMDTQSIAESLSSAIFRMHNEYNDLSSKLESTACGVLKFLDTEVPVASWHSDNTYNDYPFAADLSLEKVDETRSASVVFNLNEAVSGNFAPICDTFSGGVRI